MFKLYFLSIICIAILCNAYADDLADRQSVVLSKVDRSIDVSSQLVKTITKITLENGGSKPIRSFMHVLPVELQNKLAYLGAELNENSPLEYKLLPSSNANKDYATWEILFPRDVAPGKSLTFSVLAVLTKHLVPYPSEITQAQKQLILLNDNHYFLSLYKVKSQSTTVTLASNIIESYSRLKPVAHSDSTITYGPYENVAPLSSDKMTIHYENNKPFLTVTNLDRAIEVSHWGVISIEEKINIKHTGATLKGPFCRYEFQRDQSGFASIKQFKTILPASAQDVYYRDDIGNISTSHLRDLHDSVEIELRPRFPLFGGWKSFYTLGYNVPTYEYLFHSGNQFVLNMRFVDHIYDDSIIDEALVKIILPEGSANIEVKFPYPLARLPDEVHKTYLDTVGRPVIVLSKNNLVEQHIADIRIHYTHERFYLLQEPMLVVVALYLLFLLVIVYVRLDFSISEDPLKESKLRIMSLLEQVRSKNDTRSELYKDNETAMARFKSSKDAGAWQASLKVFNAEHKAQTQAIQEILAKLKLEGTEAAEKVSELQKLDKSLKDLVQQQSTILEKLIMSKMSKQQYIDSEATIAKKKEDSLEKMQAVVALL